MLVHESTEEELAQDGRSTSYGAVELAHRDRAEPEPSSGLTGKVLMASGVVLAIASIVRKM